MDVSSLCSQLCDGHLMRQSDAASAVDPCDFMIHVGPNETVPCGRPEGHGYHTQFGDHRIAPVPGDPPTKRWVSVTYWKVEA